MEDFIVIDKVAGEEILMVESQRVTLPGCGVISQNSLLLQRDAGLGSGPSLTRVALHL